MSGVTEDQVGDSEKSSVGGRLAGWLLAIGLLAILLLAFMHVFAPAITQDEKPPPGHPQTACIACHLVTTGSGVERP